MHNDRDRNEIVHYIQNATFKRKRNDDFRRRLLTFTQTRAAEKTPGLNVARNREIQRTR